jgi:hypothetical protein
VSFGGSLSLHSIVSGKSDGKIKRRKDEKIKRRKGRGQGKAFAALGNLDWRKVAGVGYRWVGYR